ncbi:hypothetical protein ABIB68_008035 [Bradyrhizobium sp. F1.2.2]
MTNINVDLDGVSIAASTARNGPATRGEVIRFSE